MRKKRNFLAQNRKKTKSQKQQLMPSRQSVDNRNKDYKNKHVVLKKNNPPFFTFLTIHPIINE